MFARPFLYYFVCHNGTSPLFLFYFLFLFLFLPQQTSFLLLPSQDTTLYTYCYSHMVLNFVLYYAPFISFSCLSLPSSNMLFPVSIPVIVL